MRRRDREPQPQRVDRLARERAPQTELLTRSAIKLVEEDLLELAHPRLHLQSCGVRLLGDPVYGAACLDIVSSHDPDTPLFLFLAWQAPHVPYDPVPGWHGPIFPGKLWATDVWTGRLAELLRAKRMWDSTLLVYSSDNGGVTTHDRTTGAPDAYGVNWPLRGEKHST